MPPPAVVLAALLRLCVAPLGAGVAARRCLPGGGPVIKYQNLIHKPQIQLCVAPLRAGVAARRCLIRCVPHVFVWLEAHACWGVPPLLYRWSTQHWCPTAPHLPGTTRGAARPPQMHPKAAWALLQGVSGTRRQIVWLSEALLALCRSRGAGGGQPRPAAELCRHRRAGRHSVARHQPGPGGAGRPPCAAADAAAGDGCSVHAAHSGPAV